MRTFIWSVVFLSLFCVVVSARAENLLTNSVEFVNPPRWLSESRATQVEQKIEQKMEWSVHRVKAYFHGTQDELAHEFGHAAPAILAFARRGDQSLHFGPKTNQKNFPLVFAHELTHIVLFQKYAKAIPAWLEEGMANYAAGNVKIDYAWLAKQPQLEVKSLAHPFSAKSLDEVNLAYMASLGVVLFLEKKCPSLRELINLSLDKGLENYLQSFCGIQDLHGEFWKWVSSKGSAAAH